MTFCKEQVEVIHISSANSKGCRLGVQVDTLCLGGMNTTKVYCKGIVNKYPQVVIPK